MKSPYICLVPARLCRLVYQNDSYKLPVKNRRSCKLRRAGVKPTIDVIKKLAHELDTTVGYLAGETQDQEVFKDPVMLKRLQQINSLPEEDKAHILYAIDNLLASAATRLAYGK